MTLNLSEIYEGWRNDLIPPKHLKSTIETVAKERMLICNGCEYNSVAAKKLHGYKSLRVDYHCTQCGCPLKKKTKCLSCECPLSMWTAALTEEQEETIKTNIK